MNNIINKQHRMIYVVEHDLYQKVKVMQKKYHLNISALIRDLLEQEYSKLSNNIK